MKIEMKTIEQLMHSGLRVITTAAEAGATRIAPLLSGGHDSICACFVASHHLMFDGQVHHIDTGIGAKATRAFVDELCADMGWELRVYKSRETYERYVAENGFPGPGRHQFVYNRIKDRCLRTLMKEASPHKVALVTGCRSDESERRMGHVQPVKVGETSKKTGKVAEKRRIWVAPCHDWTTADQKRFMDAYALPRNPIKLSPIGMSGECFCGAFARPYEIEMIRQICPDVAAEIDRLTIIAAANDKHCEWGTRPRRRIKGQMELEIAGSGPLCQTCDRRADASGFVVS